MFKDLIKNIQKNIIGNDFKIKITLATIFERRAYTN